MDERTLAYDFDEEKLGFEEPVRVDVTAGEPGALAGVGQKFAALLIAAGLLWFAALMLRTPVAASWGNLLSSLGVVIAGIGVYFWFGYRDSTPGIKHDGTVFSSVKSRGLIGWGLGLLITGFYVLLYWWPQYLERAIRMVDPLSQLLARQPADQWFLYGMMYTLAVVVFGVRMLFKYRHNRYQQIRTFSVMFFQLGFAFVLPNLLKAFHQPEFYFTYFWPLKPEYLWPGDFGNGWILDSGRLGVFMIFWGAVVSFIATPVLTYFFGKRWYCSWVCGCGGLAETLGDPWRHLSSKSTISWKLERAIIYTVLALVIVTTAVLWINHNSSGSIFGSFSWRAKQWYGFYIGALFSGVIGVGFYPILGSRVWCRFGCPMAAVLGLWQKFLSRFRITTNGGQCMSCGNCSTYCEMGIDVRAYAQRGENIVRASCVGCGVCSAVCPRGVLKLENGSSHADRYAGSEKPLAAFLDVLAAPAQAGKYGRGERN